MAPTEFTILSNCLLVPSQLPAIISLKEFTNLFPKSQQSSPHIRTLYRNLQARRNAVVDTVAANIENEVKRGKALRRAVVKAREEAEAQEYDDEVEIERAVRRLFSHNRLTLTTDTIAVVWRWRKCSAAEAYPELSRS